MTATAPLLSVDRLDFAYPALSLFHDWSHDFRPGVTWVRGDNGCGKSTLLQLLGGALQPRGGWIRYGVVDAVADPLAYRRHVYWCGPGGPAFDHLRPPEFFGFVAGLYPRFDATIASSLVDSLGLEPFIGKRIRELSTGTRRKVAVVAGIAACTDVLLLDEPLAALDRASVDVVRTHLAGVCAQRERIWIVASHEALGRDADAAERLDLSSHE